MWTWLQTTDVPWLIIFDNVENNERLLQNWPSTGSGQIVVTCRSELIAASPAAHSLEICHFDSIEGGELLLKLAGRTTTDADEQIAARALSELLGGLPLAIDIIARQILVKKKPMRQFLPYFVQNRENLRIPPKYASRNPYYSKNLVTVWQTAFADLSSDSFMLLGVIAMIAPDGIPRELLLRPDVAASDERWRFLSQTNRYEEAEEQLLYLSLIRINQETEMISIHRLTQEAFYFEMSEEQRHDAFELAYMLVCDAFPKRTWGRHMYEDWGVCEQLIHHVVALQDKYEDLRGRGFDNQDERFASLMADAAWFCGESHALMTGDKIGRRAADNCADRGSLVYSYLCESVATIDHRRGHYHNAYEYHNRALQVRKNSKSTPAWLLAEGYSAVGRTLYGLWRNEESLEMLNRAMEVMNSAPPEERWTFNPDRYLRNLSRSTAALERFQEAKKYAAAADECQTAMYGTDSHFHGETAYILGRMAAEEGHAELAMQLLRRAIDLQAQGKPTHQSVAAALYRQGLIFMDKQPHRKSDDEEAMLKFQHSLKICQFNELKRGDEGESPRVKWRISQILERQGRSLDAETYLAAAMRSKLALEKTSLFPTAPDELQSWDCFTDCVDR